MANPEVNRLRIFIDFDMTSFWSRTVLLASRIQKGMPLTAGVNYVQVVVYQTGYQERSAHIGTLKPSRPLARVGLDFYHLLTDHQDEDPVLGDGSPQGAFYVDSERFLDENTWKTIPLFGGACMGFEPGTTPEVSIERVGHVMHWSIQLGVVLNPHPA